MNLGIEMGKRQIIDAGMVVLLPCLMAYSLIGETFHEITGTLMLCLFLLHHWLNRNWFKTLFRSKYTPRRIVQTVVDLLLIVFMIVQPLTGILMSKHLYSFLPTANLSAFVRTIHLPLAYWGFVLMSVHAGTHLAAILKKAKRPHVVLVVMALIGVYGTVAFFRRGFPGYLLLQTAFVFFDYSQPRIFFLLDYLSIMVLFVLLGASITGQFRKHSAK